ncbi:hypothetical protein [Methanocaldococcus sp.]
MITIACNTIFNRGDIYSYSKLLIDLDSKKYQNIQSFIKRYIKLFRNIFEYKNIEIIDLEVFETSKGFHIYISINKEIDILEILFYQAVLGDQHRELSNYCRALANQMDIMNFFSIVKYTNKLSYERKTKKAIWLERKLKRIWGKIRKKEYSIYLGEYH